MKNPGQWVAGLLFAKSGTIAARVPGLRDVYQQPSGRYLITNAELSVRTHIGSLHGAQLGAKLTVPTAASILRALHRAGIM